MISQQKTTLTQRIKSFPLKSNNNSNINSYMDGNGSEMENLLDVESALQPHMSSTNIFTKKQATMSFISEGKTSHEFDQFIIALTIISIVSLILGFFSLSGVGILVISFALLSCIVSFWYCSYYVKWIMSQKPGTQDMKIIADYIKVGANAYLKTQYLTIAYYAIFTCIAIFVIYLFRENILGNDEIKISTFTIGLLTSISFLVGAVCSALAGYTGVWTSVRCNLRVASAASKMDYINSFLLSFRGGAVSSILSASMCILGISSLYILFNLIFVRIYGINESNVPLLLGGYGFGASFVALFMQLGGGIYTKAADVGADMCGKIEKGIPEDDPRNPAVIADLVGDNVGDCAGSMADVFESISGEMIGTMILGGTLCKKANLSDNTISLFIYFPLIIHSLDLIVSMIGIYFTKPKTQNEDAIIPMKRGYTISLVLAIILYFIVCKFMLDYNPETNTVFIHYGLCGIVGLLCAYCLVLITQYYTDYTHSPVKKISKASKTGHGTNIIAGISVGMESTGLPVIVISISLLISYKLGYSSGITYDINNISFGNGDMIPENLDELNLEIQHLAGLFGTACATMGMLCTAVFVLSMNNFGPIADNAGGVVEMSEQPHEVRVITDRLDAVGNVTKAATKGYAVGGSALACFLLFNAFLDDITVISNTKFKVVDITKIEVMISGLIGIMMVFLFVGWSISAVGHTAEDVVTEVRRQFREIPGLMQGKNKPNYKRCVEIVTKAALDKMKKPALLALLTPIFVGVLFRFIGDIYNLDNSGINLLGVECLSSFLIFGTLTGLLMAIFLDNSGGAWDNAKKLIESKNLKNTYEHSSAITGDTVGDPFKDTAGPALHVVMTTMSTTSLVLAPIFIGNIK